MKRHCCSKCSREIDSQDFFMESKDGKICSDCLIAAGPIEPESAHLVKVRGPKGQQPRKKERAVVIAMPLKQAL